MYVDFLTYWELATGTTDIIYKVLINKSKMIENFLKN